MHACPTVRRQQHRPLKCKAHKQDEYTTITQQRNPASALDLTRTSLSSSSTRSGLTIVVILLIGPTHHYFTSRGSLVLVLAASRLLPPPCSFPPLPSVVLATAGGQRRRRQATEDIVCRRGRRRLEPHRRRTSHRCGFQTNERTNKLVACFLYLFLVVVVAGRLLKNLPGPSVAA